jgi:hypothetical protein
MSEQVERQAEQIADAIAEPVERADGPVSRTRIEREIGTDAKPDAEKERLYQSSEVTGISIDEEVDRLFGELTPGLQHNPVTGQLFVMGLDPLDEQKRLARLALEARKWVAQHGPAYLPPLSVDLYKIEELKMGQNLSHLFAYYANSVASLDYDVTLHLPFEEYAAAVLALPHAPDFFTENGELKRRFPPRAAQRGRFEQNSLRWKPSELHKAA